MYFLSLILLVRLTTTRTNIMYFYSKALRRKQENHLKYISSNPTVLVLFSKFSIPLDKYLICLIIHLNHIYIITLTYTYLSHVIIHC